MSQPSFQSFADLFQSSEFIHRHIGISQDEKEAMLKAVGADSMASFIEQTVPASVRLSKELDLPLSMTEHDALAKLRGLADKIKVNKSIFMFTPRHILYQKISLLALALFVSQKS